MELVLLGTAGGPRPSSNRAAPAQAILHNGELFVVDCGSGVAGQAVKAGIDLSTLRGIFITHHHADHMLDMGALPLTAWTDGLVDEIDILGPPPTSNSVEAFLEMVSAELAARTATTGRTPLDQLLNVSEVTSPGTVFERGDLTVTATFVDHPPFEIALGYRFDSPSGSVVFSGDTRYSPALVSLAQGADVLVHEAIYEPALELQLTGAGAATLRQHLIGCHTTAEDAGRVAREAGVGTLVLTHLVPYHDGVTDEMWRAAAATQFDGDIIVGRDLMKLPIPHSSETLQDD